MKTAHFFIFSVLLLISTSCTPDRYDGRKSSVIILGISVNNESLSGRYVSKYIRDGEDGHSFLFHAKPEEFEFEVQNSDHINYLYGAARRGELSAKASATESFAYELISKRNKPLVEQYENYLDRLLEAGTIPNKNNSSASFITAYVRGVPSIIANDVLFGQPAGTDLSEWFRFEDTNLISVTGTDYKMVERADNVNELMTSSEYFTYDKLLPNDIRFRLIDIPEEIMPRYPAEHHEDEELIKVSITIPVCYERYWEWCKALYKNPDAEEVFDNRRILIQLYFIRKL